MPTDNKLIAAQNEIKDTWNRLFTILRTAKNSSIQDCHTLNDLPANEREGYIAQVWGGAALGKCGQLLAKIAMLETNLQTMVNTPQKPVPGTMRQQKP